MASAPVLSRRLLDEGPLILDGGLATELEAQGAKLQVSIFMDATCQKQTNKTCNATRKSH